MNEMGNAVSDIWVELNQEEIQHCEVIDDGAGLSGEFNHTSELHVMKWKGVMIGPNGEAGNKELS